MAEHWLVSRLAGDKKESQRWIELSEALESFWDNNLHARVQGVADSRSIFTAEESDLQKLLKELGDFYDVNLQIENENKPLAIAWRRNEIHLKNTRLTIESIIKRNFSGLEVRWEALYARKDKDYSLDNLFSEQEVKDLGWNIDDLFMTSRGRLWIHKSQFISLGLTKQDFRLAAQKEIAKIKPTHIVYDGEFLALEVSLNYQSQNLSYVANTHEKTREVMLTESEADSHKVAQNEQVLTHVDDCNRSTRWSFDEIPADFAPLDMPVAVSQA